MPLNGGDRSLSFGTPVDNGLGRVSSPVGRPDFKSGGGAEITPLWVRLLPLPPKAIRGLVIEESAKSFIHAGAVIDDGRERGDDDEDAKPVFDGIGVLDNRRQLRRDVLGHGFPGVCNYPAVRRLPAVLPFPAIRHNPAIGDVFVIHRCPAICLGPAIRPGPVLCH